MSIQTIFYIKLFINLGLTVGMVWVVANTDLFRKWQQSNDKAILGLGFLVLRLIPWAAIFILLNETPRGDIPFFFYKADAAKQGGFVYRDFWSYHAPLYSYIISLPVWIWHNSKAIVLFMVLMEAGILWLTYETLKAKSGRALQYSVLYLLLPAAFMYILVDGQEEVWFWGAALLIWRYTIKKPENYEIGIGIIYAIALLTIKVTFILLLPAMLVVVRRPLKMLITMAAIGLPAVGFLYWQIGDLFLMPIRHTEQLMTPNLFSVSRPFVELFVHVDEKKSMTLNWIGLLFTIFVPVTLAFIGRKRHINEILPALFVSCFACMMIFQASAMGAYIVCYLMAALFVCFDISKPTHVIILVLLNWLTVVQPFVWVSIGQPHYLSFDMFANKTFLLEYCLQILNLLSFCWILRQAYIKIASPLNLVPA